MGQLLETAQQQGRRTVLSLWPSTGAPGLARSILKKAALIEQESRKFGTPFVNNRPLGKSALEATASPLTLHLTTSGQAQRKGDGEPKESLGVTSSPSKPYPTMMTFARSPGHD